MIDWQKIDTVLLDMDGTLLDLYFDNYFWLKYLPKAYAEQQGLSQQESEKHLFKRFSDIQGTLNWYSLDYWTEQLGVNILALKQDIRHLIAVREGVWDFLAFLQREHKQVTLVTNAHPDSLALKMKVTRMAKYFDGMVSSHDLGHPKESQNFWQALLKSRPFNPKKTLFLDDTPSILDAAAKFGIGHLWAIYQPDSQGSPKPLGAYPQMKSFQELIGAT